MNSRYLTVLLIGLVGLLSVHVVHNFAAPLRMDVTENQVFSLSEGTKSILKRMQSDSTQKIEARLYFSDSTGRTLPRLIKQFMAYRNHVEWLLREYEQASGGLVQLSVIDPTPEGDHEQDALDFGLSGQPINNDGDRFFFGLVFQTETGSRELIPFLLPDQQESLEYEITKKLYKLVWPQQKRVGILSSLDVLTDDDPYLAQMMAAQGKQPTQSWLITEVLKESYDLKSISKDVETISKDDFDLLVVVHPKGLSEKTLFAIDEWVVTGGRTLVFADAYCIDDQPPPGNQFAAMSHRADSSLDKLFAAWGLERPIDEFAADLTLAVKRPVSRNGMPQLIPVDLMFKPEARENTMDVSSPIMQGVENVRLLLAGHLQSVEGAAVPMQPLLTTTGVGNVLTLRTGFPSGEELTVMDLNNPAKLTDAFQQGTQPRVLAGVLSGQFPSAFPAGTKYPKEAAAAPPGAPPGFQPPADPNAEMIEKAAVDPANFKETTVIVFADVDLLGDQIAFQKTFLGVMPVNDNFKLVANSIDYLLGSTELMAVRATVSNRRPFKLFDEIEAASDATLLSKEKEIRSRIQLFEKQLQDKQRGMTEENAALLEKQVRDEVNTLNDSLRIENRKLLEIRREKRRDIDSETSFGWSVAMFPTQILVLILGLGFWFTRWSRNNAARRA